MGLLLFFLIAGALCGGFQEDKRPKRKNNVYDSWNSSERERLDYYHYRKQHGYE